MIPEDDVKADGMSVSLTEVPTRGLRLRLVRENLPVFAVLQPRQPTPAPSKQPETPGLSALAARLASPLVRVDVVDPAADGRQRRLQQQARQVAQVRLVVVITRR